MTRTVLFWSSAFFRGLPRPEKKNRPRPGSMTATVVEARCRRRSAAEYAQFDGRRGGGITRTVLFWSAAFFPRPSAARKKNLPRT
jgi:hypothetical protein